VLAGLHHPRLTDFFARLEDLREVIAALRVWRRDNVVDRSPFLRPDVAEQVSGNRLAGRNDGLAILLRQIPAHVTMQRVVERLHLRPQPVHLGRELIRRHVVLCAPHRPGVGIAEVARAFLQKNFAVTLIGSDR